MNPGFLRPLVAALFVILVGGAQPADAAGDDETKLPLEAARKASFSTERATWNE